MRIVSVVLLASTLAAVACAGPGATAKPAAAGQAAVTGQRAPGPFSANGEASGSSGRVSTELQDAMKFRPNVFTAVKPGAQVTVDMKNTGATIHNFVSPSLGVAAAVKVDPGKSANVTFTAPSSPGTYQYWCNEPGHAEAGMVGQVVVQ